MKSFVTLAVGLVLITAAAGLAADAMISIGGEVKTPGRQLHKEGITILAAIKAAGGVTERASTKVRLTPSGQKPTTLDRTELQSGKVSDRKLQPGDEVFVPRR